MTGKCLHSLLCRLLNKKKKTSSKTSNDEVVGLSEVLPLMHAMDMQLKILHTSYQNKVDCPFLISEGPSTTNQITQFYFFYMLLLLIIIADTVIKRII